MKIAVIGAGTMGAGIATSCLAAGDDVVSVEASAEQTTAGRALIQNSLERLAVKNDDLDVAECLNRLAQVDDIEGTVGCDLVIEAIPEILEAKQTLFAALDELHEPGVILGTNTSSLSIDQIASKAASPDRIVGTHFFNPCLLYTSPSPRDQRGSRMPSSA